MDITVEFLHPTDGRLLTVELDNTMTVQEATAELISAEFIPPNKSGYGLAVKGGGSLFEVNESFEDAGVVDGDTIRVIPNTDGGGIEKHSTTKEGKTFSFYGEQAFRRIGKAAGINLDNLEQNITQARQESNQFFKLTIIFSGLGFLIIAFGIILLFFDKTTAGIITATSSIIPEVTAILFFAKDRELRRAIHTYHQYMLDSQRLLTMVDLSETIEDTEQRDKIKQEIVYNTLQIKNDVENSKTI